MYDSRQYIEATRPPEFIARNGTRYVGRLLSVDEWQPFELRMQAASRGELAWPELQSLIRDLVREFFPRGWRFWTLRFWRPCWWWVAKLPPVGQLQAVYSFMRSQGQALGTEMSTPTPRIQRLLGLNSSNPVDASPSAG